MADNRFDAMFPRTRWDIHLDDVNLMRQMLVVAEECGEASEALRKMHGDKTLGMEVADVMLAASGLLHRLHDRTGIEPEEFLRRARHKNAVRGYYETGVE